MLFLVGKAASTETTEFLLNVPSNGMKQMKTFIKECVDDNARFDRAIKRNTIKNFSHEISKSKTKSTKQIDDIRTERNILAQVLCLSLENKIDLCNILSYPLTTVPYAFSHFEGTMHSNCKKTELTTLFMSNEIVQSCRNFKPENINVDIIDGYYFLSGFREVPLKYGQFAKFFLQQICNTEAHEIHVIFDKCEDTSPRNVIMRKCMELHENFSIHFKISGPNQERNSSLSKCLSSSSFKDELIKFFIKFLTESESTASILKNKRVFLSFGKKCYLFSDHCEMGKDLSSFENNHFEIESKMILHIYKVRAMNICVRVSNPDTILIYLLYHMQFLPIEKNIYLETGNVNKNNVQFINVRQIFSSLNPELINALPAWYAFTGCPYEPSFYGKGRKICLKALEKKYEFQTTFATIGSESNQPKEEEITILEEFTCQLYSTKQKDVNSARVKLFHDAYDTKSEIDFKKNGMYYVFYKNMFKMST